jgi:hypothetical protein
MTLASPSAPTAQVSFMASDKTAPVTPDTIAAAGSTTEAAAPHTPRESFPPTRWSGMVRRRVRKGFGVLIWWVVERRAVASVLGLLEAREAVARERVEVLREEAARAAAELEAAEVELDRRVIAREELVEALAVSAEAAADVEEGEDGSEVAPFPEPVSAAAQGAVVPRRREGLAVSVLSLDNQQILKVLRDRPGAEPLRVRKIAAVLGIDAAVAAKVEGVRSKAKRLAERGWLFQKASGAFSAGRWGAEGSAKVAK